MSKPNIVIEVINEVSQVIMGILTVMVYVYFIGFIFCFLVTGWDNSVSMLLTSVALSGVVAVLLIINLLFIFPRI